MPYSENLPLDPSVPALSKPDWWPVAPAAHLDLIRELFLHNAVRSGRELTPENFDRLWRDHEPKVRAQIAAGEASMEMARFDFDQDGDEDTVVRYSGRPFIPTPLHPIDEVGQRWWLSPLDEDGTSTSAFAAMATSSIPRTFCSTTARRMSRTWGHPA